MDEKNAFEAALSDFGLRYWEYDITTKRLYRSSLVQGEVGYSAYKDNVPESYVEEGIIHPDYAQAYLDFYHAIQRGENAQLTFRSLYGNGQWGWLDISYKVLFDEEGKPFKAIGVGGDVTEAKKRESKLKEIEKQNQIIGYMLESTASYEYDYITYIDGINDKFMSYSSRVIGNVVVGKQLEEHLQGDFREGLCEDYETLVHDFQWKAILDGLKADGEYIRYATIYDQDGVRHRKKYSFFYINRTDMLILETCRDVTTLFESTEAQKEALSEALTAANTANRAKSDFLSSMSHEIRTPMNAILGLSALGLDETSDESAKGYFEQIQSSGKFLLGLINDILDMSRIEQGKIELHEEYVNGVEFLESVAALVRPIAEQKGIILKTDFSKAQTPWVRMDRMRSEQIYVNLLNNAIKFSQSGNVVEWNMVDVEDDEHHMHMESNIIDHGCGMSYEFQKKIFQPFSQERKMDKNPQQGTGLGLAIVKNLVEQMGGTLTFVSTPDIGSTFTVRLNRDVSYQEKIKQVSTIEDLQDESILQGKHVLLCEDHPINAAIAQRLLQKKGIYVDYAENGQIGVNRFKNSISGFYDAILMDIRMPVKDGMEATKDIRSMDRKDAGTVPIIAMTANAFESDKQKALEAGMNRHLAKPVEPEKLYQALASVMK